MVLQMGRELGVGYKLYPTVACGIECWPRRCVPMQRRLPILFKYQSITPKKLNSFNAISYGYKGERCSYDQGVWGFEKSSKTGLSNYRTKHVMTILKQLIFGLQGKK